MSSSGVEQGVAVSESEPPRGNRSRFAFACAILASMTSIILGYGSSSLKIIITHLTFHFIFCSVFRFK